MRTILIFVLSLTLIAGLSLAGYFAYLNLASPPTAPSIEVRSMQSNANSVTLALTIRGKNLARAELWADEKLIGRETNPNPNIGSAWNLVFRWTPASDGAYSLTARVFDTQEQYTGQTLFTFVVPPQKKILYSTNRAGNYGLFTLSADGLQVVSFLPAASQYRQPDVSRDGALAFASMENGAWHIRVRQTASGLPLDITPDLGSAQRPVWSVDGKRLAFEVTGAGKTNIFISDPEGKNRTQLTQGDEYDGQVTFAPTNNVLAFASLQGGNWDLYAVGFDGSNLLRLTSEPSQDWQPAWSPKGDKIAFVSNRSGQFQIHLMNSDGTGVVRLTDFPNGVEQPTWSFDGRWLAFVALTGEGEKENRREIYLMSADGRGITRLTQNAFDDTEPTWLP